MAQGIRFAVGSAIFGELQPADVALQTDGRIVAAGSIANPGAQSTQFAVGRFDGSYEVYRADFSGGAAVKLATNQGGTR